MNSLCNPHNSPKEIIKRDLSSIITVPSWMSGIIGFLLWFPGVGFPVLENQYLQPAEILVLGWMFFIAFPRACIFWDFKINRYLLIMTGGMLASWIISTLFSVSPSKSSIYLSYYITFILPWMFLLFQIAISGLLLVKFIHGFIFGACVSTCVGLAQLMLGDRLFKLVNNINFSLIYGLNKASGFTPEASILAGLLIISLAIILLLLSSESHRIYFLKMQASSLLTDRSKLFIILFFLMTGLFSTLSTSVIIIIPAIVLFILIMMRRYLSFLKKILIVCLLISIIILFYFFVWLQRSSADTSGSMLMRGASMIIGAKIALENWTIGVGLGMTKDIIAEPVLQLLSRWGDVKLWIGASSKTGVDSFPLHLLAEQGFLAFILLTIAGYWILSSYKKISSMEQNEMITMDIVIAFVSFIVGVASAGYRGLFHLWIFFPFAAAVHSSVDKADVQVDSK